MKLSVLNFLIELTFVQLAMPKARSPHAFLFEKLVHEVNFRMKYWD